MALNEIVQRVARDHGRLYITDDCNYPCSTCALRGTRNCIGDNCGAWADWYTAAHNETRKMILSNIRRFDY